MLWHATKLMVYLVSCVALALTPSACGRKAAAPEPQPTAAPKVNAYQLAPGDQLLISVYQEQDLSGKFTVDTEGFVTLPLVQRVRLTDLTGAEAEQLLTSLYADGYLIDPQISVQIIRHQPFYVMGEVSKPGQYEYTPDLTLQEAIARAGGYTYRADEDDVDVHRSSQSLHIEDDDIFIFSVRPGDVIQVRERTF